MEMIFSPLLFNFPLEHSIREVKENYKNFSAMNYKLLVCADDGNIRSENINNHKRKHISSISC
jgi:hypothetical protein